MTGGNQAFAFIGTGAFTGVAGQLRFGPAGRQHVRRRRHRRQRCRRVHHADRHDQPRGDRLRALRREGRVRRPGSRGLRAPGRTPRSAAARSRAEARRARHWPGPCAASAWHRSRFAGHCAELLGGKGRAMPGDAQQRLLPCPPSRAAAALADQVFEPRPAAHRGPADHGAKPVSDPPPATGCGWPGRMPVVDQRVVARDLGGKAVGQEGAAGGAGARE